MGLDGEKSDCGSMEEAPALSHRPHGSIMEEREDEFEGESDTDDNEEGDFEYNTDMSAIDDGHCLMNDHGFCMLMETIKKKNGARQEAAAMDGVVAKMAVLDIKDELKARGLDTSGAKGIVAGRLRISIASDSARARVYTGRKLTACAQTRLLELAPPHFLTLGVPRVL